MKLIILLFILLLGNFTHSQIKLFADTAANRKITSIKSTFYILKGNKKYSHNYGEKKYRDGLLLASIWLDKNGVKTQQLEYTYSDDRRLLAIHRRRFKPDETSYLDSDSTIYIYDNDNRLCKVLKYEKGRVRANATITNTFEGTEVLRVYRFNTTWDTSTVTLEKINAKNKTISFTSGLTTWLYEYDETGLKTKRTNMTGDILYNESYSFYNDDSKLIKSYTISKNADTTFSLSYLYDKHDKLRMIDYNKPGNRIEYTYNRKGLLKSKTVYLGREFNGQIKVNEYKYSFR